MNLKLFSINENYDNFSDLINFVNAFAGFQGYAMIKFRIKIFKKDVFRKAVLKCDRGGGFKAKDHEKRQHIIFRLIECEFKAIAILNKNDNGHLTIKESSHNHAIIFVVSHSILRKAVMIQNIKVSIHIQSNLHIVFKKIISGIRVNENDENLMFLPKNVYNAKILMKRKNLESLTPIQALFRNLKNDNKGFFKYEINNHDQVNFLVFFNNSCFLTDRCNHSSNICFLTKNHFKKYGKNIENYYG